MRDDQGQAIDREEGSELIKKNPGKEKGPDDGDRETQID